MRMQQAGIVGMALGMLLCLMSVGYAADTGTSFTWDGYLVDGTTFLDGQYDLRFRLFDLAAGGTQLGKDVFMQNTQVSAGYFSGTLDFGVSIFDGQTRYVESAFRLGSLNDPYPYKALNAPRLPVYRTNGTILAEAIGIGTNYPDGKLNVNGSLVVSGGNNIILKGNGRDAGDIVFQGGNGTQLSRIWTAPSEPNQLHLCTNAVSQPDITINGTGDLHAHKNIVLDYDRTVGVLGDSFTYEGKTAYNYGLRWTVDSWRTDGPTAWFASWGGIKLFTGEAVRIAITADGDVGIGTTTPTQKLDVAGYVHAKGYYTGDLFFQKGGRTLWRMFEDEAGLYVENAASGKKYDVVLRESGSAKAMGVDPTVAELKAENAALKQKMAELEAKLDALAQKLP